MVSLQPGFKLMYVSLNLVLLLALQSTFTLADGLHPNHGAAHADHAIRRHAAQAGRLSKRFPPVSVYSDNAASVDRRDRHHYHKHYSNLTPEELDELLAEQQLEDSDIFVDDATSSSTRRRFRTRTSSSSQETASNASARTSTLSTSTAESATRAHSSASSTDSAEQPSSTSSHPSSSSSDSDTHSSRSTSSHSLDATSVSSATEPTSLASQSATSSSSSHSSDSSSKSNNGLLGGLLNMSPSSSSSAPRQTVHSSESPDDGSSPSSSKQSQSSQPDFFGFTPSATRSSTSTSSTPAATASASSTSSSASRATVDSAPTAAPSSFGSSSDLTADANSDTLSSKTSTTANGGLLGGLLGSSRGSSDIASQTSSSEVSVPTDSVIDGNTAGGASSTSDSSLTITSTTAGDSTGSSTATLSSSSSGAAGPTSSSQAPATTSTGFVSTSSADTGSSTDGGSASSSSGAPSSSASSSKATSSSESSQSSSSHSDSSSSTSTTTSNPYWYANTQSLNLGPSSTSSAKAEAPTSTQSTEGTDDGSSSSGSSSGNTNASASGGANNSPAAEDLPTTIIPSASSYDQPPGSTSIGILFKQDMQWTWVISQADLTAQIFAFMPDLVSQPAGLDSAKVSTVKLASYSPQAGNTVSTGTLSTARTLYMAYVPTSSVEDIQALVANTSSPFYTAAASGAAQQLASQVDPTFNILSVAGSVASGAKQNAKSSSGSTTDSPTLRNSMIGVGCGLAGAFALVAGGLIWRKRRNGEDEAGAGGKDGGVSRAHTIRSFGHGGLRETWAPGALDQHPDFNATGDMQQVWSSHGGMAMDHGDGFGGYVASDPFYDGGAAGGYVNMNRSSRMTERSAYSDLSQMTESQRIQYNYEASRRSFHSTSDQSGLHGSHSEHSADSGSGMLSTYQEDYRVPRQNTSNHAFGVRSNSVNRTRRRGSVASSIIGRPEMIGNSVLL